MSCKHCENLSTKCESCGDIFGSFHKRLFEQRDKELIEAQEQFKRYKEHWGKYKTGYYRELERAEKAEALYQDLIMQVACKFPNESRHETAKRYILERENTEAVECKEVE